MARSILQAIQEREDELKFAVSCDGFDEQTTEILEILQLAKLGLWAETIGIPALRGSARAIAFSDLPDEVKDRLRDAVGSLQTKASSDIAF